MSKTLIAYYSRKGENYYAGSIVNLAKGNTEVVAEKIMDITGGDIFEIDTVKDYPKNYNACTNVAQEELDKDARPKLTATVDNMDDYDIIYLGYPNWWGTFPMAVATFLESYDLTGKTILPFCTHEGSGMGSSEKHVESLCINSVVVNGLSIRGSSVAKSDGALRKWIEG